MRKHTTRILSVTQRIIRRLYLARKRMKLTALLALCVSLFTTAHIYTTTWIYPNTYVQGASISMGLKSSVEHRRQEILHMQYKMRVQNREYVYSLADFGVEIDSDLLLSEVYQPNVQPFPENILLLFVSLFRPRYIETPLVFTQEYDQFIDQTVYDFSESTDQVEFNQEQKALIVVENEEKYRIDSDAFKKLLSSRIAQTQLPLYPKLVKVKNEQTDALHDIAERIKRMFLNPMTVYVDAGGTTKAFTLTERELADISTVSWQESADSRLVDIHGELAIRILNEHVKKVGLLTKGNVVSPKVIKDLEDALISRFHERQVDAIKIYYDKGPNSDGRLADKYIEVDISQQKMYTFVRGKLHKEYRVSTGRDYPTPVGEFTVLNKAELGFSKIYDVWMAWWMGFKYSDELHAFFGIHELPYTLTDGEKIQRPANFIGTPNTGGCVALGVGDAQEVYRFADIGTKIIIFK